MKKADFISAQVSHNHINNHPVTQEGALLEGGSILAQTHPAPYTWLSDFNEKVIYIYLQKFPYFNERLKSQTSLQRTNSWQRLLHSIQNEVLKRSLLYQHLDSTNFSCYSKQSPLFKILRLKLSDVGTLALSEFKKRAMTNTAFSSNMLHDFLKWNLCIDHKNHSYFRDNGGQNRVNVVRQQDGQKAF